jgi:hypothetical protein
VLEVRSLDPNSIYERSIGRPEVSKKALRRSDLEYAVVARKKSILRQTELRVLTPPDHESIVLVECEVASGLRAGNYV